MINASALAFFWGSVWKEAKEDSYSATVGNTGASATLVGYIESQYLALATGCILGFSTVIPTPMGLMLYRVPPASHPRIRNLYASSVKISPFSFQVAGKPAWPPIELSPSLLSTSTSAWIPTESYNIPAKTSRYEVLKVEIDFSEFVGITFASNLQTDFHSVYLNREYLRYTSVTFEPSVEVLQMDSVASLVFDEGPAKDHSFPTPVGIMLPQAKIKLKWWWVPHAFVSDSPIGKIPFRRLFQSTLGTVNSTPFLHFPPGTLLFTGYSTEPIAVPFPDVASNSVVMQLAWNIEFEFSLLETVAAEWVEDVPLFRNFGHNVFPYRGDRRFYPASIREEGEDYRSAAPLYSGSDFGLMFRSFKI